MTGDPSQAEIYQQAEALRLARPVEETAIQQEVTLPVQFAGAVLTLHAGALKSWNSRWGKPSHCSLSHSRGFIGDAMFALEWFEGDSQGSLTFQRCCELLSIDQKNFWSRLQKSFKPAAMLWLNILRGIEQAHLELAGDPLARDEEWTIPLAESLRPHRKLPIARATLHWERGGYLL